MVGGLAVIGRCVFRVPLTRGRSVGAWWGWWRIYTAGIWSARNELGLSIGPLPAARSTDQLVHLPAMLVRFERIGDKVAICWPNTSFAAQRESPAALASERNFPQSVEGVGQVTATDAKTGDVIFDASPLLQDELDFNNGAGLHGRRAIVACPRTNSSPGQA